MSSRRRRSPTVISAGRISGRMIRKKIPKWLQPSISAASSSSFGMPRMNCMIMKMKKAIPKNRGRRSG